MSSEEKTSNNHINLNNNINNNNNSTSNSSTSSSISTGNNGSGSSSSKKKNFEGFKKVGEFARCGSGGGVLPGSDINDHASGSNNIINSSLTNGASNNGMGVVEEEDDDNDEEEPMYNYKFIHGTVPSFEYNDPVALNMIKEQVPVILKGADLVASAMKWDLDYLATHIGSGPFAVFVRNATADAIIQSHKPVQSQQPEPLHIFKYFDEKKLVALQDKSTFQSTMVRVEMTFQEFLKRFHGDRTHERVYLQQPLNNTVGPQIAADFVQFNWSWAAEQKKEFNWGPLTSNLLLIGQKGNITPCHFDEQQNLFCPLRGRKKILLFHPDNFPCLYPYPVHHPNDRQSQVNLDAPDLEKFPKFANAKGVEAVVGPGDILYIPMLWWHHVINLDDTIAINFWHKAGGGTQIEYPLQARQRIAMVRNVEKMLLEALQDQNDLKELLHWIVDGRF